MFNNLVCPACRAIPHDLAMEGLGYGVALALKDIQKRRGEVPS